MIKRVSDEELEGVFPAEEGEGNLYYGMIGSGKSYGATADIIELLKQGKVVYATWPIYVEDFDDRESFLMAMWNLVRFNKRFFKVPCSKNLHYINAEVGEVDGVPTFNPNRPSEYIDYLNTLNHCTLFIDEAWRVIDSYKGTQFSIGGRDLILVTRHKFRTVNLIAQRPTSVHVSARGNMNRFYKFKKTKFLWWIRFTRYEFQEMTGETVNEDAEPVSVKGYWANKAIFKAYNSYYYGGLKPLHPLFMEAWDYGFLDRFYLLFKPLKRLIHRLSTPPFFDKNSKKH